MQIQNIIMGLVSLTLSLSLISCDAHDDHILPPDTTMKVCDIVCTDGSVMRYDDFSKSGKTAEAVVFFVNHGDASHQGTGYAICLNDIEEAAFADSLGVSQGTSANVDSYDGNSNTYSLMNSRIYSPMANKVFGYMHDGQSAYIPSVAQMRLILGAKSSINGYLALVGGTPLPTTANKSWYWTSTEVEGQQPLKAWLYSIESGARLETNKLQEHKVRPIITIYK